MNSMNGNYKQTVYLAKLAKTCERYDYMMDLGEEMVKMKNKDLTLEERKLIFDAYKSRYDLLKKEMQTIKSEQEIELEYAEEEINCYIEYFQVYKNKVCLDLQTLCNRIIECVDKFLVPNSNSDESTMYYNKMKADYCRYISEYVSEPLKQMYIEKSLVGYKAAVEASNEIGYNNAIKLGLGLNMSVFYHDVLEKSDEGFKIAQETLDSALKAFEAVNEENDNNKIDGKIIIDLMTENLELWKTEESFS